MVRGIFLRAYRICSDAYIEAEIKHIFDSFTKPKYPKAFIVRCLQKAKTIRRNPTATQAKSRHRISVAPISGTYNSRNFKNAEQSRCTTYRKTGIQDR